MKACYIAGKMRGVPLSNFPRFDSAAKILRDGEWFVISPADMDRNAGFDPSKDEHVEYTPEMNRKIVERDTDAILALRPEEGDILVIIDEWQKSVGTTAEIALARWLGIPVFRLEWQPEKLSDGPYMLMKMDVSL